MQNQHPWGIFVGPFEQILLKRSVRCSLIFLLLNIIPEFPERTLLDYLYTGQLPQSVDEEGRDGSKWIMMSIEFCFVVFSCCSLCLLRRWSLAPSGQIPPACADQAPWGPPCKVVIGIIVENFGSIQFLLQQVGTFLSLSSPPSCPFLPLSSHLRDPWSAFEGIEGKWT